MAGTQTTSSTIREPSTLRGHPHCWHRDDFIANAGDLNLIANFDFAGFAGWHRLHHDGGSAEQWLEARSFKATRGSPLCSYSIVNFADFAGAAAKVGNS